VLDTVRTDLARQQAALVRALAGESAPPPGFDQGRLEVVRASLAGKRARGVARAWPSLEGALGAGLFVQFRAFARESPYPGEGGPLADGWRFVSWLARQGTLPAAVRLEAMDVALHYRATRAGLKRRREPALAVRVTSFRHPCRVVLGSRWITIRLDEGIGLRQRLGFRRPII
jgi:hypothetical protein